MSDRDSSKYTVWFISGDQQGSMFGGNFDTEDAANASIPEFEAEMRSMCNEECPYDEDSYFQVEPPIADDDE